MKVGRHNTGEPKHVRLYEWMRKSPAWQSLDVYERQLYVEFKARYTGNNNGDIAFSGAEMAEAMNCSNRPADRALSTLLERGFVKLAKKGAFDWKWRREGGSRANTYILTEYPVDYPAKVLSGPTKDFMKWRSEQPQKKARGDESTRMGVREHPISEEMGVREHPNGVSTSPDTSFPSHMNGVTRAPTYNLPEGGGEAGRPGPSGEPPLATGATGGRTDGGRRHG